MDKFQMGERKRKTERYTVDGTVQRPHKLNILFLSLKEYTQGAVDFSA
jgi:hypothetical protein